MAGELPKTRVLWDPIVDSPHKEVLASTVDEETLRMPQRRYHRGRIFFLPDPFKRLLSLEVWLKILEVMWETQERHIFIIYTEYPERFRELHEAADFVKYRLPGFAETDTTLPGNAWIGTIVHTQAEANVRVPKLMQIDAVVRIIKVIPQEWVSLLTIPRPDNAYLLQRGEMGVLPDRNEPDDYVWACKSLIHGVVAGGEENPVHPDWIRALRDQCRKARVPFSFEGWGDWKPAACIYGDGEKGVVRMQTDGTIRAFTDEASTMDTILARVGRDVSGRMLDGRIWDDYPEPIGLE